MAITTEIGEGNFDKVVSQTTATNASNDNVFNAAGSVFVIQSKNTSSSTDAYLKLYDSAGPTVGTTAPDFILFSIQGVTQHVICRGGIVFSTAVSLAAVQNAGTEGTTNPESAVNVTIIGA